MDKDEADLASALCNWFESQDVKPKLALTTMASLMAVIIAKVARNEEDLLDGIAACARDMIELGVKAHKIGKE